jgi:hypothetical protein
MYYQIACQLDPLPGWKWKSFIEFINIVMCKVNREKIKNLNIPPQTFTIVCYKKINSPFL